MAVVTVGPLAMGAKYSVCSGGKCTGGGRTAGGAGGVDALATFLDSAFACANRASFDCGRPFGGVGSEDEGMSAPFEGVGADGLLMIAACRRSDDCDDEGVGGRL